MKSFFITGAAGFIGYHISNRLLDEGWRVIGLDCMSDYYDVSLKSQREDMLLQIKDYRSIHERLEAPGVLLRLFEEEKPDYIINYAALAYATSWENSFRYYETNKLLSYEKSE